MADSNWVLLQFRLGLQNDVLPLPLIWTLLRDHALKKWTTQTPTLIIFVAMMDFDSMSESRPALLTLTPILIPVVKKKTPTGTPN